MELYKNKFFDKMGNLKPNSHQENSENPSTCNAPLALMLDMLELYSYADTFNIRLLNLHKRATNGGNYLTNEYDYSKYIKQLEGCKWWQWPIVKLNLHRYTFIYKLFKLERSSYRFSHDETNGVCSTSYYFKDASGLDKKNLAAIKVATPQTFIRMYDVGFSTLYAKTQDTLFLIPVKFFAKRTCASRSLDARGEYHASGKQQVFIRLVGLRLEDTFKECTALLPEKDGWVEVFRNFYPEEDHPINVCARLCRARGLF